MQNEEKRKSIINRASSTGLIVGIVIVALILISLLVILTIFLIKGKSSLDHDQSHSDDNVDEINDGTISMTNTVTDESQFVTKDNPLFDQAEIQNDSDLFNNDIEE